MHKLFFLFLPLLLAACVSVTPPSSLDNQIMPGYLRPEPGSLILMLPPEAEVFELQPGIEILKRELHRQLRAAGYKVVILDRKNYESIWAEEVTEVGGIYDSATGALRQPEFTRALSYLIQRLSSETKAALVLRPRLVLRKAELSGSSARWDDQQRRVPVTGQGGDSARHDGNTLGLSVELMAFTSSSALALHMYGGASLPFRVNLVTRQNEVRADLFASDTELADAVALTLLPIIK